MIGGNTAAELQVKTSSEKNTIGERIETWETVVELLGWLDLTGGDAKHTYATKLEETTHIFLCDYQKLSVTNENARLLIDEQIYEIVLIDNPMNMKEHLEIYLKFVGGQDVS